MGWFTGIFGGAKPEPPVLPVTVNAPTPKGPPLEKVVVVTNTSSALQGATAPQFPPPTFGANALKAGLPPQARIGNPRRGEYVALGGARKSKKSKGKKSKKSKKNKSKKL